MEISLAKKLMEVRIEKKLTQAEVAAKLGVSKTCYAGYEQGHRKPSVDMLRQLCILFGVSADYLLELED